MRSIMWRCDHMVQLRSDLSCTMWSQCHNARPSQTDHRCGACQQGEMTTSLCAKTSFHACMCKILQINQKYDKYAASAGCANKKASPPDPSPGLCPLDTRWGLLPQTPVIGSRYRACHSRLSPTTNFVPTPLYTLVIMQTSFSWISQRHSTKFPTES